jgi:hypothetical protein
MLLFIIACNGKNPDLPLWEEVGVPLESADYTFVGENIEDRAGFFVAAVGDVDGDTVSDFMIGADYFGGSEIFSGRAYLFTAQGLGQAGEISIAEADYTIIAERNKSLVGHNFSSAGDMDGDGKDDFLISGYIDSNGKNENGTVYLIHASELTQPEVYLEDIAYQWYGEMELAKLGHNVSGNADVDGDGIPDILTGAYGHQEGRGKGYLMFGSNIQPGRQSISNTDHYFNGEVADDRLGYTMTFVGDIDGDGYDDLHMSSKYNDTVDTDAGKTYLFYGSTINAQEEAEVDMQSANHVFYGEGLENWCCKLFRMGDLDGDSKPDLIFGAQYQEIESLGSGLAYVVLSSTLGATGSRSLADADYKFVGENYGDAMGISQVGVGDLDGDGTEDLLMGAFRHSSSSTIQGGGVAYLFFGGNLGASGRTLTGGDADYRFEATTNLEAVGRHVAGIGDISGDGKPDFLIGAPLEFDYSYLGSGKAYLMITP